MVEQIRDVEVHIAVDTNKQTHNLDLAGLSMWEAKLHIKEFFDGITVD